MAQGKGKRRTPAKLPRVSAADASLLAAIEALRTNPAYREAEEMRRKVGALSMAQAPEGSRERTGIQMLVGTWISIATLLRAAKHKGDLYRILPICHMYRAFVDAIKQLREIAGSDDYARELDELYEDWQDWCDRMELDPHYVTALCGGITARFG